MPDTHIQNNNAKVRRGRPTQLQAQLKMAAVLRVAREAFVLNGYRATTMELIALKAGVSKRTLYFWHADKAALFMACTLEGSRQLVRPEPELNQEISTGLRSYAAKLITQLSSHENYGMAQLLAREGRDFPELTEAVRYGHDIYLVQPLAEFLKQHGFGGDVATNGARLFIAMVLSEIDRSILFAQPIPTSRQIDEHADLVADIFLYGFRARQ